MLRLLVTIQLGSRLFFSASLFFLSLSLSSHLPWLPGYEIEKLTSAPRFHIKVKWEKLIPARLPGLLQGEMEKSTLDPGFTLRCHGNIDLSSQVSLQGEMEKTDLGSQIDPA